MRILYLLLIFVHFFYPAYANEDKGLYDLPPKGAAFLRFVNVDARNNHEIIVNQKELPALTSYDVSNYYIVPNADVKIETLGTVEKPKLKPDHFYTFLVSKNGLVPIEDKRNEDISKAQISFYNLSDKSDLSLKTTDDKILVIKETPINSANSTPINPVFLSSALFDKNGSLHRELESFQMDNRQYYSIFAFANGQVKVITAAIEPLP